jgi:hypothetical protein
MDGNRIMPRCQMQVVRQMCIATGELLKHPAQASMQTRAPSVQQCASGESRLAVTHREDERQMLGARALRVLRRDCLKEPLLGDAASGLDPGQLQAAWALRADVAAAELSAGFKDPTLLPLEGRGRLRCSKVPSGTLMKLEGTITARRDTRCVIKHMQAVSLCLRGETVRDGVCDGLMDGV